MRTTGQHFLGLGAFLMLGAAWGCGSGAGSDDDAVALRARTIAKHPKADDKDDKDEGEPLLAGPPAKVWTPAPAPHGPIAYVMPVDHGIRRDSGGAGQFRAPRGHGEHNGIDLLAPIGTPTHSICNGRAKTGTSSSFGHWIRVVCEVPETMVGETGLYASIFYAHLDVSDLSGSDWQFVSRGQPMGAVGKSGNARGSTIAPHLHFEIAIHDSEKGAQEETHYGSNQKNNKGADRFVRGIERNCLDPEGFTSYASVRRARRIDPFMFMTCGMAPKPELASPPAELAGKMLPWHKQYDANFDVNVGRWLPAPSM